MNINIRNIDLNKAKGTLPCMQFIRPHGGRNPVHIPVSGLTVLSWQWLQAHSGNKIRLTSEDLGNGKTSLCIEHSDKGDMDIKLVPSNEPTAIPAKFSEMIAKMYHDQWIDELRHLAMSEMEFTPAQAAAIDGELFWMQYGIKCESPKDAATHLQLPHNPPTP